MCRGSPEKQLQKKELERPRRAGGGQESRRGGEGETEGTRGEREEGSCPGKWEFRRKREMVERDSRRVSLCGVQCNHPSTPKHIQEKYGFNGFVSKSP